MTVSCSNTQCRNFSIDVLKALWDKSAKESQKKEEKAIPFEPNPFDDLDNETTLPYYTDWKIK